VLARLVSLPRNEVPLSSRRCRGKLAAT